MRETMRAALFVLDGYGISPSKEGNAVVAAKTPCLDRLFSENPYTELTASGVDVGLPAGQMGNSEVGHLNIGAGRVVKQELNRIGSEIEEGGFFRNPVFLGAIEHAKKHDGKLHLIGLCSDGGVHSHIDHLKALLRLAKKRDMKKTYVHVITDGRDTSPRSGLEYVKDLESYMQTEGCGTIASVIGRYYAMDRDKRWERVQEAYRAMTAFSEDSRKAETAENALAASYEAEVTDEFVVPTTIVDAKGHPVALVESGDAIVFYNFRPDRAREIARAFLDREFDGFARSKIEHLYYAGMTLYDPTIEGIETAYLPEVYKNTLGEYVASKGLRQLRIAETEKYPHVTFFFNGGVEVPNPGEDRILVASPKVATYDLQPEMSAPEVTDRLIDALKQNVYDLVICNFANPDMVGHTGVLKAAVKAVETVNHAMERLIPVLEDCGYSYIVTADHGNCETMFDEDGGPMTAHTTNPVPCAVVPSKDFLASKKAGTAENPTSVALRNGGRLADLAPTILELMGLEQPKEMTGKSLIEK